MLGIRAMYAAILTYDSSVHELLFATSTLSLSMSNRTKDRPRNWFRNKLGLSLSVLALVHIEFVKLIVASSF